MGVLKELFFDVRIKRSWESDEVLIGCNPLLHLAYVEGNQSSPVCFEFDVPVDTVILCIIKLDCLESQASLCQYFKVLLSCAVHVCILISGGGGFALRSFTGILYFIIEKYGSNLALNG